MKHTNFINIAIRILTAFQKGVRKNAQTYETLRLKEYEEVWSDDYRFSDVLALITACKARMYTTKKDAVFGIANAIRDFGRPAVMAMVNANPTYACPSPAYYTGTHDLDDLSFTRAGLNTFCEKICKEVWCMAFCQNSPYEPTLDMDQDDFETRWQSWEYWGRYATDCFYR